MTVIKYFAVGLLRKKESDDCISTSPTVVRRCVRCLKSMRPI